MIELQGKLMEGEDTRQLEKEVDRLQECLYSSVKRCHTKVENKVLEDLRHRGSSGRQVTNYNW